MAPNNILNLDGSLGGLLTREALNVPPPQRHGSVRVFMEGGKQVDKIVKVYEENGSLITSSIAEPGAEYRAAKGWRGKRGKASAEMAPKAEP